MSTQKKRKVKKRYFAVYLYMLFILLALTSVASYTWFTISQTPRVSDMKMYVNSSTGLELSHTPEDQYSWTQHLEYSDVVPGRIPLRPATWSEKDQRFYAAAYGMDGRLLDYDSWWPLTDTGNANRNDAYGYYAKFTIYARSGTPTNVRLFDAGTITALSEAYGTFVMGAPSFDMEGLMNIDGGKGAQNAIRFGIRTTYLDKTLNPLEDKEGNFFIYEPNCDRHATATEEYIKTPSIDGTDSLVPAERLIRQKALTWRDLNIAQINRVKIDLGEILDDVVLFDVGPETIVQMDIYIWLEGQDPECTNLMSGAQIIANLQFIADIDDPSGMVSIDTLYTEPTEPNTDPTITTE